jgi:translation initiation factor IF-1
MTRKILAFLLVAVIATGAAFAHDPKSQQLLGTVKELHENHLMVQTPDGHEVTVQLTETTQYEKDKKAATRSALVAGVRVSIQLAKDNKTAAKVKIGAAPAK